LESNVKDERVSKIDIIKFLPMGNLGVVVQAKKKKKMVNGAAMTEEEKEQVEELERMKQ